MLCRLLASTGVAGDPHEWFWRDSARDFRRRWGVTSDEEYVARVLHAGTTPNGVFGAKLMWGYFEELLAWLRGFRAVADDRELLACFFPEARFVWLRREDAVAQAVSWAKAIQSGHWHTWDPPARGPLEFRAEAIGHLVDEIRGHDAAWRTWFDAHEIRPLLVTYEELAEAPECVTREVLAGLGLAVPAGVSLSTDTELERDELNDEWAARYRRLRAERGAGSK